MKQARYTLHVELDPPPIPIREHDWQGSIDGMEEITSASGPNAADVVRQLADWIEEQ